MSRWTKQQTLTVMQVLPPIDVDLIMPGATADPLLCRNPSLWRVPKELTP